MVARQSTVRHLLYLPLLLVILVVTCPAVDAQFGRLGRQNKQALADESAARKSASLWGKKKASADKKKQQGGNFVKDLAEDVMDFAEDVGDLAEDVMEDIGEMVVANPVFAGKVRPALKKLAITGEKAAEIWNAVTKAVHVDDVAFLAVFGWAFVPAVEFVYEFGDDDEDEEEASKEAEAAAAGDADSQSDQSSLAEPTKVEFGKTILFQVADHFSQFCRIGLSVLAVDVLEILLAAMGFNFRNLDQLSEAFAKVAYSIWAAQRLKVFKRYLIASAVKRPTSDLGRAGLADHILDSVLYGLTAFFLLDWLDVELGLGIKSMLTFGSAGTLIVSLASKDLAGQLINGLALTASDKIYEGERVKFSDGLSGVIEKMGWMETTIRMDDEHTLSIGNTELSNKRIINLSRTKQSQVHLSLRFSYADIEVLPTVLEDIKAEIRAACPELIDDGSRPFRAVLSDYQSSHLEVHVEAVSAHCCCYCCYVLFSVGCFFTALLTASFRLFVLSFIIPALPISISTYPPYRKTITKIRKGCCTLSIKR